MTTFAVIPARGGSQGLPRKQLRRLAGEPMIAHTIRAALTAQGVDRVVVSTDDERIARVALAYGAEVPFLRPANLAEDATPTLPVIQHAVRLLEAVGEIVSVVVTLQPTSPLRTAAQIDAALDLLRSSGARAVVSVAPLGLPASVIGAVVDGRFHPLPMEPGTDLRRQGSPVAFRLTGAIYVTSRDLLAEGSLLGVEPMALISNGPTAIDVDTMADLRAARRAMKRLGSRGGDQ